MNEKTCENGTISLERENNENAFIVLVLRLKNKYFTLKSMSLYKKNPSQTNFISFVLHAGSRKARKKHLQNFGYKNKNLSFN